MGAIHPFFKHICARPGLHNMLSRICDRSLSFASYAEGDACFEAEDEATAMYFVHTGMFLYTIDSKKKKCLEKRSWLSEAALWTAWTHRGALYSCGPGDLFSLSPVKFADVMRLHPRTFYLANNYGT